MKFNHEFIKIKELKPHPKNPKQHFDEQINGIAKLIDELGWGRPIIISKDKYILAGHGAVLAAKQLGYTKVPYRVMKWNHDSPEALTYLIADNKSSELATWDNTLLLDDLIELNASGLDVELTMFDTDEIYELKVELNSIQDGESIPEDEQEFDESIADEIPFIKCPKCGYEIPK